MTLSFDDKGRRVEPVETPEIRPVVLEYQPVFVTGGKQVSVSVSQSPLPVAITIDPEKVKS
jgi:hypothetical protein